MENSELRRVQLGHGNEMSLHSTPTAGPDCSPSGRGPGNGITQPSRPNPTLFGFSLDGT